MAQAQAQAISEWLSIARKVVAFYENMGDADMVADAQARVDRLSAGVVLTVDTDGLADWADYLSE